MKHFSPAESCRSFAPSFQAANLYELHGRADELISESWHGKSFGKKQSEWFRLGAAWFKYTSFSTNLSKDPKP